jgi:hypothetical protein
MRGQDFIEQILILPFRSFQKMQNKERIIRVKQLSEHFIRRVGLSPAQVGNRSKCVQWVSVTCLVPVAPALRMPDLSTTVCAWTTAGHTLRKGTEHVGGFPYRWELVTFVDSCTGTVLRTVGEYSRGSHVGATSNLTLTIQTRDLSEPFYSTYTWLFNVFYDRHTWFS